jgi:hypothetical protein
MKMNELVEFLNPKYVYIQLIPTFSVRNYKSDDFISMIARLYVKIDDRIDAINKKLIIEGDAKLGYYIHMEKNQDPELSGVNFYFVIPEKHFKMFEDKIYETWSNKIDFKQVDTIPDFDINCSIYTLDYKRNDAFSLTCDKRDNELLVRQLNTLHIMETGDKVGVFYNFMPMNQKFWKSNWDNNIKDLKEGITNLRCTTKTGAFIMAIINWSMKLSDSIIAALVGAKKEALTKRLPVKDLEISRWTLKKRDEYIAKCQILCFSQSPDHSRERANGLTLCHSFECLSENNTLDFKKLNPKHNKKINLHDSKIKYTPSFCIQPGEGQSFIGLPGREPLERFPIIRRIESLQCDTPVELRTGVIAIGYNKYYNGEIIKTYLPSSARERCWLLLILGPTRAGKTNLIGNISKDATEGGECTILFDICGHCELSDAVTEIVGKKKVLNIDCSDIDNLQGMGYNEVPINLDNSFYQYESAKIKASQLKNLMNSVNDDDRDLKAKMNKLINAASLIVFINNGSINEVFRVLLSYNIREKYIRLIPTEQKENLADSISVLRELNEKYSQGKPTGESKMTPAVSGIMDRLDSLKTNTYMEFMLKKDCTNNICLTDEIQKNQVICLRIPEKLFSTPPEKDAFCVYWMTKIWLAVKIRDDNLPREKHVKVNLVVDELSQVPHTEAFLKSILSQMAKFTCKTIVSAHYLNQLKIIRQEVRSANASYMMLAGCDRENYDDLKHEFDPYTVDDLLHLKEFTSLNLIKTGNGFVKFITQLPPKIL